jgi:hypothetical protein
MQQKLLGPSFSIELQEEADQHCHYGTCYCYYNHNNVDEKMRTCLAGCYYHYNYYNGELVVVMELKLEPILVVVVCIKLLSVCT